MQRIADRFVLASHPLNRNGLVICQSDASAVNTVGIAASCLRIKVDRDVATIGIRALIRQVHAVHSVIGIFSRFGQGDAYRPLIVKRLAPESIPDNADKASLICAGCEINFPLVN